MPRGKIEHEGKTYYTVPAAAKVLRTNVVKVKQLMADRRLEWLNLRVNGPLYITASSLFDCQEEILRQRRAAYLAAKASRG